MAKGQSEIMWGLVIIAGLVVAGFVVLSGIFVQVDQTEIGVVRCFGQVCGTLTPGLHLMIPIYQSVMKFPTFEKTMEFAGTEQITSLSSEGLNVNFDMAFQYAIDPTKATEVYSKLGENYEVWMHNRMRAKARDIIAQYRADELYSTERTAIQAKFESEMAIEFAPYGIVMKSVLIRGIVLPEPVVQSIQMKISAKQDSERMDFVITKETKEAQRKVIEAGGIADSNKIIAGSLTENYLRWYWIQHVVMGANSSIMYVPVGQDGLPLMKTV